MTSLLKTIANDALNLMRWGSGAPLKNMVLYADPLDIHLEIDSKNDAFQKAILGEHANSRMPDTARKARNVFRKSSNVIVDNDFDLYCTPIEENQRIRQVDHMLQNGLTWEEAGFYDFMLEAIAERGSLDGCHNLNDVKQRYRMLDRIVETIRAGDRLSPNTAVFGRYGSINGVVAAVGRSGQLIFCGSGKHRLAISRSLKSDAIPLHIAAVHRQAVSDKTWQSLLQRSQELVGKNIKRSSVEQTTR